MLLCKGIFFYICIVTSITNRERFFSHIAQTSDSPLAIEITHAEGVYVFSKDKTYIDCISGISVSNVGHSNPNVIRAVKDQLEKHTHIMVYGETIQESQTALAEHLSTFLPKQLHSVYYVNSGTEAIEGAMKLSKRYTGRQRFVAIKSAYHGSSQGALSLMSESYFSNAFVPLMPGVDFMDQNAIDQIDQVITRDTAAVFVEPIMGEKGYLPCTKDFLDALRKRCTETETLLVFDEVQSGYGRTGKLFACIEFGVYPDILVLAKGFGGGLPLGAFISSNDIMSVLKDRPVLGHITTFGGHALSCAASMAALKFIQEEKLLSEIKQKEALFRSLLQDPAILRIDGCGLMLAIVFEQANFCRKVIDLCVEDGLLIDWFLYAENRIRLSPPLIISEKQIRVICGIILGNIKKAVQP